MTNLSEILHEAKVFEKYKILTCNMSMVVKNDKFE